MFESHRTPDANLPARLGVCGGALLALAGFGLVVGLAPHRL